MVHLLWENILSVRKKSPLVHNITNYVVMNTTANALLAIGASPIMAHAPEEVEDMVGICDSLVINIGTLEASWVQAMLQAASKANALHKPFVVDPVGAGASAYRDTVLSQLVALRPTVIRGNASEIMALAHTNKSATKGVDSTEQSNEALTAAVVLNQKFGSIICISGAQDIIVSKDHYVQVDNGNALMTKVTGLGCTATALIGAFLGCIEDQQQAVISATALMSIAGEIAAEQAKGPGSLQTILLDTLYTLTEDEFKNRINLTTLYEK
ncbi:hydroxyethylthiazole kinase [Flavobacterium sp. SM2513]|uniref:hydroxyethylthiazole kinase n=1 Tax=Flavobacterium sp. SM2513 TaxID=3424766 RepID=UPI003D7FF1D7